MAPRFPALLVSLVVLGFGSADAQGVLQVDNLTACNGRSPCYTTISDAVAAAGPGGVIEIFAGVYPEVVTNFHGQPNLMIRAQSAVRPPVIVGGFSFVPGAAAPGLHLKNLIIEGDIFILAGGMAGGVIENNQIRGAYGITGLRPADLTIRNNVVVGGAIEIVDDPLAETYAAHGTLSRSVIEGNTLHDAWIAIGGDDSTADNVIRRNVVRGGGIALFNVFGRLQNNLVEGNFVSGSPEDGISAVGAGFGTHSSGANNTFKNNTSVGNAGCDIRDTGGGDGAPSNNVWKNNRFVTTCTREILSTE